MEGPAWSDDHGWGWVQYWSTIRLADVTGDGRADLCARSASDFRCPPSEGTSFGEALIGPALSDDKGWADYSNYSTIRMADLDGDRKVDLCARANKGIVCWLATGTGFGPAIDGPALSDDSGWSGDRFHRTIRLGDIDGDGDADLCARAAAGVACWRWSGGGFEAEPVPGPAWSDQSGWGAEQYCGTMQLGGAACRGRVEECNGADDDCDGEVDEGCPEGGGPGADGDAGIGEDGDMGGGCRASGTGGGAWWAAVLAGLLLAGRRRRAARQ